MTHACGCRQWVRLNAFGYVTGGFVETSVNRILKHGYAVLSLVFGFVCPLAAATWGQKGLCFMKKKSITKQSIDWTLLDTGFYSRLPGQYHSESVKEDRYTATRIQVGCSWLLTPAIWRFVTETGMRTLFTRLADVQIPNLFERNGVSSLRLEHTRRISAPMRQLRLSGVA